MSVASKNLYALLGNDDEGSEQPSAPVKTVDKNPPRTTKRNVEPVAPSKPVTANTGARRGPGGNEGAFRDKTAGSGANQRRTTEEAPRGGARGGRGARERGGRGGRFPRDRDDRHAKGVASGSEKQAAQSWGAAEGEAEQKDEQAGEELAQTELKEAVVEDAENVDETPAEPESKHISYADYLAQQAEKKLALGSGPEIRKANEGSKLDKKWASAKELVKEKTDDFIAGSAGKTKRERERKEKQVVEIDHGFVESDRPRGGARGGRGGPRGGRGEGRGRGDGRGRGEARGRGGARGGREGASINTSDTSAFPSLGA